MICARPPDFTLAMRTCNATRSQWLNLREAASLLTLAVICGSTRMVNARSSFVLFLFAGLISGLFSGISVVLPLLGLLAPGFFFGAAIGYSLHATITRLSPWQHAALLLTSGVGYFAAAVACLFSTRLPGINNGLPSSAFAGAIGGGVGALIVACSLAVVASGVLSPLRTVVIVTLAGSLFGAIFLFCGVYISDRTAFGHPWDDVVTFPLWQSGVASVIPFCRHRVTEWSGARLSG